MEIAKKGIHWRQRAVHGAEAKQEQDSQQASTRKARVRQVLWQPNYPLG